MIFTIVKEYWEQGSRPGRMKLNLVRNQTTIEADSLDAAKEIMVKRFDHSVQISYHESMFHSIHLFEGDVSDMENPFFNRKRWTMENQEVVLAHRRWALKGELPGYWAELNPEQQQIVGMTMKLSTEAAETVARHFQRSNLPA